MTTATSWRPGDKVAVLLPDKSLPWARSVWVTGTVGAVDVPIRGVHVDLDREINGVRDCHATHDELRPA